MESGDGRADRIVAAAAGLLDAGGRDAVSTRAVSAAAGVQAPTIYRLFGDMQGLLDAVAAYGLTTYLGQKTGVPPAADPVDDLRVGWDLHVGFGLAHPALYALMYGALRTGPPPPALAAGVEVLARRVRRVAEAGRLRVTEERAAQLIHAAGSGTTLALIATPEEHRDPALSDTAREAVIAAITTDAAPTASPGPVVAAVTLRATLSQVEVLTGPELGLLRAWLDRIAAQRVD